jgi:hypothetical protein
MHKDIFVHAGIYAINWEANSISIFLPRVIDEVPAGHPHSHIRDTALQGKEKTPHDAWDQQPDPYTK